MLTGHESQERFTKNSRILWHGLPVSFKYSATNKVSKWLVTQCFHFNQASAFNASYSDSGLFGFYVVAEPSDVSKVQITFVSWLI